MAEKSYWELLKDPRWQRKRLEILERDDWSCLSCGDKERTLHVHHRRYRRGAMPWEYDGAELLTLCDRCHESITADVKAITDLVNRWNAPAVSGMRALLEAWMRDRPARTLVEMLAFIAEGDGE